MSLDDMWGSDHEESNKLGRKKPLKFQKSTISSVQQCQSSDAVNMCIFDIQYKLENKDEYDIGGTYTEQKPDLWFYMKTEACPGANLLLNLFVCHRNIGFVSIGISDSNELKTDKDYSDCVFLSEELTWKSYKSVKSDQCHYLKSFVFNAELLEGLKGKTLVIPLKIQNTPTFKLDINLIERVKKKHNMISAIKKEVCDFTLVSNSNKKYPAHKIVLCSQSPVLKDMIKNTSGELLKLDLKDEVIELLLEYIYTGNIKNMANYENVLLLETAIKFKLSSLMPEIESAIKCNISVENAVDVAKLSQEYQLKEVEKSIFKFFKENPQIFKTEAWKNFNDVVLTKKLLEYVYLES